MRPTPAPLTHRPGARRVELRPRLNSGGDAFGYYWLDLTTFACSISRHMLSGSAMHSVTVLNVLRQRVLPNVDFRNPSE